VRKILLLLPTIVTPLASQARIDWQAKEAAVYRAVVEVNVDAVAANLDSAYVGIYPRGIIDREAQIAAVKGEWTSFELAQFTAQALDSQTVLLTYRLTTQGASGGTFWASTVWRLTGGRWRWVLHTAAPAT
jgi:hypothetical protein